MAKRTRCLPLYLPGDIYTALERVAKANERDPLEQARWMLRRTLEQHDSLQHSTEGRTRPMKLVIAIDLPDEHTPTDHGFLVGALNKLIKEKIPTAHWSFSTYSDQQAVDAWIEAFRQRGASR